VDKHSIRMSLKKRAQLSSAQLVSLDPTHRIDPHVECESASVSASCWTNPAPATGWSPNFHDLLATAKERQQERKRELRIYKMQQVRSLHSELSGFHTHLFESPCVLQFVR
jgi:hypothetical protein